MTHIPIAILTTIYIIICNIFNVINSAFKSTKNIYKSQLLKGRYSLNVKEFTTVYKTYDEVKEEEEAFDKFIAVKYEQD